MHLHVGNNFGNGMGLPNQAARKLLGKLFPFAA
jgi:hypothetical protein